MPIFFQQEVNGDTRLAVWKIEEPESFFLDKVPLHRAITHPHKRLQHLAGRYLLQHLYPDFPIRLIQIADTRKPFLEDEAFHFSISHCGDYAAAIVSPVNRVGVDIEQITEKITRIEHKFVSEEERVLVQSPWMPDTGKSALDGTPVDHVRKLGLLWSSKEAVFKWYGWGEVDFRRHICIQSVVPTGNGSFDTIVQFKKNEDLFLGLHSYFFGDVCLSYVVT
ncbi:MAG TPA: 4'-phosphopantetheinyl transferase superfamily protein [Chitinophagaceae bacterium]